MKYREVARKLADLGCRELPRKRGGSHCKWFNPVSQQATVVPDWEVATSSWERFVRPSGNWVLIGRSFKTCRTECFHN